MLIPSRSSTRLQTSRLFIYRRRMFSEYRSRGYEEAIVALNSLQSNASVLAAIQAAGPQPSERVFGQTNYYLRRLGYKPKDLNVLNAIHISGTKGKGSTAAFCSSLLNTINPSAKVGLFTSPHLVAVRERIRINGKPISEEMFSRYFWELWERFEDGNGEPVRPDLPIRPAYFRYLTYMAYHAFIAERVDATVFEVGVGGLLDPTNLIPSPIVTGVSSLGIDHVNVLGHSIAEIAGHKGGIFKPGVPALTVQQQYPETINVLRARALELKSSSFTIIPRRPDLDQLKIGLAGSHQKHNASFAIALVNTFLGSPRLPHSYSKHASPIRDTTASGTPSDLLPPLPSDPSPTLPESVDPRQPELPKDLVQPELSGLFKAGITNTRWPGRCQTIVDPVRSGVTWFLDGAHTVDSLELCGQWWNQQLESSSSSFSTHPTSNQPRRILIFNCTFGRKARDLLEGLIKPLSQNLYGGFFDQVIITSNTTYSDGKFKSDLRSVAQDTLSDPDQRIQQEIAEAWTSMSNSTKNVMVVNSIEQAVDEVARKNLLSGSTSVLVTGSLHLIGGLLDVLGFEDAL
ncbi:Folylpolyglutamate synthetase [Puccinia graminis f. sp. tritici]|uniref:Folylpolyglutamate synthase n=2 Tax=Puccinia graminis f. sp. tritici TaxID=56615 RepID=A0A5B0P604_PUCGR|nr:Folylpolyglutamate synthetase [Puccinia graminis f. sp. tritici]KAA1137198.1 Folylpolyglutamate synthetase [Puccinia graminis f. sp. tritici]